MIYAVCSKDQYILSQEAIKLIDMLKIDDVFKYDASDISEGDLLQELCTSSLFGEKCIVVSHPIFLDNSYKFTYKSDFINFFNNSNPDVSLIVLIDFDFDKNNELIKLIDKKNFTIIANLEDKDLKSFVLNYLANDNIKIDDNALNELLIRCSDTLSITNELEKLKLYCTNNCIVLSDVSTLVSLSVDAKIYELSNYLFSKNTKMLISTYYDIVQMSLIKSDKRSYDVNSSIVGEITKRITEIFYVKELMKKKFSQDQIAEFLNIKRNVAYYKMEDARKVSVSFLESLTNRLVKLDLELKSLNIDKSLAMELFLLGK